MNLPIQKVTVVATCNGLPFSWDGTIRGTLVKCNKWHCQLSKLINEAKKDGYVIVCVASPSKQLWP